jgi:hypothetical protein
MKRHAADAAKLSCVRLFGLLLLVAASTVFFERGRFAVTKIWDPADRQNFSSPGVSVVSLLLENRHLREQLASVAVGRGEGHAASSQPGAPAEKNFSSRSLVTRGADGALQKTEGGKENVKTFLFFAGVEGTGHHFVSALLKSCKNCVSNGPVGGLLYSHGSNLSLWSSSCNYPGSDSKLIFRKLVTALRKYWKELPQKAVIPLNCGRSNGNTGMMSYPNFGGKCRWSQHPDLDSLFEACDVAGVNCGVVVLTRDADKVIKSTSINRKYSPVATQIRMMTTMLSVINSQIQRHPHRVLACWNYDTWSGSKELGNVLGYSNDAFLSLVKREYVSKGKSNFSVPPQHQPLMKSMRLANDQLMSACKAALAQ